MNNMKTITVNSSSRIEMIDITSKIREKIQDVNNGSCVIFIPHTTAAITINENFDSNVVKDMISAFKKLIPNENFLHVEGNSQAHILSTLIGQSLSLIIKNGNLLLGQWQGVFFVELDGPRQRKIYLKVVKNAV